MKYLYAWFSLCTHICGRQRVINIKSHCLMSNWRIFIVYSVPTIQQYVFFSVWYSTHRDYEQSMRMGRDGKHRKENPPAKFKFKNSQFYRKLFLMFTNMFWYHWNIGYLFKEVQYGIRTKKAVINFKVCHIAIMISF